MIRQAAAFLVLALPSTAAAAPPEHEALFDALEVDRTVALMRAESVSRGEDLAGELFPGRGVAGWRASLERIYDEGAMRQRMRDGMSEALADRDVGPIVDFYTGELGTRIVGLELAAREGMADEDVEEAARATWGLMPEDDPDRAAAIMAFVEVNDLVERNVEGALNAHLDFLRGLDAGGALPDPMGEDEMLAEVWSTEGQVREEMVDWLGAHMVLAYEPLEDDEFDAYLAFSEGEAGQLLNRALFAGFEAMYEGISRDLGRAAAVQMMGFDL